MDAAPTWLLIVSAQVSELHHSRLAAAWLFQDVLQLLPSSVEHVHAFLFQVQVPHDGNAKYFCGAAAERCVQASVWPRC